MIQEIELENDHLELGERDSFVEIIVTAEFAKENPTMSQFDVVVIFLLVMLIIYFTGCPIPPIFKRRKSKSKKQQDNDETPIEV